MKGEIVFDSVEGELFMYILLSCSKCIKWSFVFKFMLDHVLCPMDHTEKKKNHIHLHSQYMKFHPIWFENITTKGLYKMQWSCLMLSNYFTCE